jgi:hypothetical protein
MMTFNTINTQGYSQFNNLDTSIGKHINFQSAFT